MQKWPWPERLKPIPNGDLGRVNLSAHRSESQADRELLLHAATLAKAAHHQIIECGFAQVRRRTGSAVASSPCSPRSGASSPSCGDSAWNGRRVHRVFTQSP
jgi:hypothetical protein